jgi:hypothetical protein
MCDESVRMKTISLRCWCWKIEPSFDFLFLLIWKWTWWKKVRWWKFVVFGSVHKGSLGGEGQTSPYKFCKTSFVNISFVVKLVGLGYWRFCKMMVSEQCWGTGVPGTLLGAVESPRNVLDTFGKPWKHSEKFKISGISCDGVTRRKKGCSTLGSTGVRYPLSPPYLSSKGWHL